MYILVNLLNGYARSLMYEVPFDMSDNVQVGSVVHVPLQQRVERALVCGIQVEGKNQTFSIRKIITIEPIPFDGAYHDFMQQIARYYAVSPIYLYRRLHHMKTLSEDEIPQLSELPPTHESPVMLTTEQQEIVSALCAPLEQPCYYPALIYGATGSGKTEIYIRLIEIAFQQRKTTLFLLPEVSLAISFTLLLRTRFLGKIPVLDYHSATTAPDKRRVWQAIVAQEPIVIVGVHVPVLLPLANLGLIIIDEEHDSGFQEKRNPRINTKEVALLRAQLYNIPLVMGSATPSLSSLHYVKTKNWNLFRLTQRFAGSFPQVMHASLTKKSYRWKDAEQRWITDQLHDAIAERLQRNEQTIIFLNRRGLHHFVQCRSCAYLFSCTSCSVTLTLHAGNCLLCHYCGLQLSLPACCPACQTDQRDFIKKGIGTQRLVELLAIRFPHARIARADLDTTRQKKLWNTTITAMQDGAIDILVGTQTITKGYHFPRVTLVGVIWAESNLSVPFYNAAEITLQQLIQVAGRAGRASQHGEVIIQSFIEHQIFSYLRESQYMDFYEYEIAHRTSLGYPPCNRLSAIELQHEDEKMLEHAAQQCCAYLRSYCSKRGLQVTVLGPALPPVHRIKHMSTRRIYLKSASIGLHIELFHAARKRTMLKSFWFQPNPLQ
jgi:primosomal protein N' (replication factor Y)